MFARTMASWGVFLAIIACAAAAQGPGIAPPPTDDRHPFDGGTQNSSPLNDENPALFTLSSGLFSDTTNIDFEKRQISFVRTDSLGFVLSAHHYGEMDDYLADRWDSALERTVAENSLLSKSGGGAGHSESLRLAWELPVQYPGWAQRVLGTDPPRLSINGSMRIKIGFEDQSRKNPGVEEVLRGGAGFVFDQSNQFTISGSVGRLININISANSEGDVDMNNPLKNFKIEYKEQKQDELEDEIVQEVIAGYTGFSMPGTQLSGYSESKEGLFGIKVASRFGPLLLTTIASTEQGESQKLSVSNSGKGDAATTNTQKESDFIKYRYFFLDTAYISAWNRKYAISGGSLSSRPPPEVKELDVWRQIEVTDEQLLISTYGTKNVGKFYVDLPRGQRHQFVRLQPERHYKLYEREGYIRLFDTSGVREQDILAISMKTEGGAFDKGTAGDTLWVIKPAVAFDYIDQDPAKFRLMWRNVYRLSGEIEDITKFNIRVYLEGKDVQDTNFNVGTVLISKILGLTDANGEALTAQRNFYSFATSELIIPPFDTSALGNEPFANPAFGAMRDTAIYRYGPQSRFMTDNYQPLFSIETSGASKQTRFDLGIGVMENTVRVKADGMLLTANTDYVFSSEIGTLELTSPRATAAQKIDIEYQREALFMPERKIFLGSRAEMKLPFISDNSLMGLSVLYQSSAVSQRVPRLNQEPYSKLLFDFNAKLDFEPEWMTPLVNKIPLVKTDAKSSANVEFEIAHSRMNPNSSKQAFVDDFESSKQIYSMGESYASWYTASPPWHGDSLSWRPPAWDYYWFTPVMKDKKNHVLKSSVWTLDEKDDAMSGMDNYESVLRLHVRPAPSDPDYHKRYERAWAGIMQPIPVSMSDRKRDQYFEFVLKSRNNGTGKGKLRIQIGRLSEDICIAGAEPNGSPDKEDTAKFWRELNVKELDRGLDTLKDAMEYYTIPNGAGGWEKVSSTISAIGNWPDTIFFNDPAKDNYNAYAEDYPQNYMYACRLDGNGISSNTEDIDNNGTVETSTAEVYHEFVIDLADTTSPLIDKSTADKLKTQNGWRRYRLHLRDNYANYPGVRNDVGVGIDEWTNMRMVRFIWDEFDAANLAVEDSLIFTGIQFVGNQWEAIRDSAGKSKIEVSVIGTRESEEYKNSLGTTDKILRENNETGGQQHEQSLRLVFKDLGQDETALVERSFSNQPLKVASYDSLTMVVHGKGPTPPLGRPFYGGDIKFVFRFGTDSTSYYEYRRAIMPGWNNYVAIDLKKVSRLKLDWLTKHPTDSMDAWSDDSTLHIRAPKGRQPNFANITWMAVGVECKRSVRNNNSGEIWVDELKVVGIKQFNGFSSRLNLSTQLADFLSINGGLNYEGGDFKTMTDQDITRTGDSRFSGNLSLSTGIDRFMPKSWGVSMPVGGSFTSSLTRPQLKPNSDIYLTNKNTPDGFFEMARDVAADATGMESLSADTMTLAEHFETQSQGESFFINYSKNGDHSNPAVDLLLDRITTNFQYNKQTNLVRRGEKPDSSGDYQNTDTSQTYTGSIKYDLTPREPPKWTSWKPFGENPASWVPGQFKNLELSLLPNRANLDLANATYSKTSEQRQEPGMAETEKQSQVFDVSHGLSLDFSPIKPFLDLSYGLNVIRNFPNSSNLEQAGQFSDFMRDDVLKRHSDGTWREYYILERERSRSQKFKLTLSTQFVDWLTNSADYSADYSQSLSKWGNDSTTDFINGKVNTGVNFNSYLTISSLFPAAADSGKPGIRARLRKGFDYVGLNSVNFTYSNNANLTNNYLGSDYLSGGSDGGSRVSGREFMAYQLGLQGRSASDVIFGDMDDRNALGGMRSRWESDRYNKDKYDYYKDDNRSVNQSYQVSTSLSLAKPIDLRLSSISLRWNRQFSVRPDTARFDTTRSFPELNLGAQSGILDKIKLINRYVQSANLSSNFSMKRSIKNNDAQGKEYAESFELSPLVQIDGTVKKWPITFNYQHTMGQEERALQNRDGTPGDVISTRRDGDNLTMNYEVPQSSGTSTIKILKWAVPVKGRTTMGMRMVRDHSVSITAQEKTADNSNLSVSPHLSYVVTSNITGTLEYSLARTTENGAITTTNTLSIITEIRF